MYDLQSRLIAQHRGCELSELQAILDEMNTGHWDLADRFAYCAFLGGLVHIQLSVVEGEDAWIILPAVAAADDDWVISRADPVNRVGLQMVWFAPGHLLMHCLLGNPHLFAATFPSMP